MTNQLSTYGKPTIKQRMRSALQTKVWYRAYAPLHLGTHEEEQ